MDNLYISSLTVFRKLIFDLLAFQQPRRVIEVGVESGDFSSLLSDWCEQQGAHLVSVDPSDRDGDWWRELTHVTRIFATSLEVQGELAKSDAVIIDGDHNWYTVYHELQCIYSERKADGQLPLVILHDVGWPCGRRDFYYAPARIPDWARQSHDWELGVELDSADAVVGGLRGCGSFAVALTEGGQRNGVLTAVHDFLHDHRLPLRFCHLDAFLGLGVLFDERIEGPATIMRAYHSPLLAQLEHNRLAIWCSLVKLQDKVASDAT